ncbi:uncharacterized protein L3040_007937 [Drepanopeziza brunnea f. sp. 'multigermtubi']|uniref:Amino-acid permease inda1 n=1 Tax=Marssonina brunnea f. sp. multigermtubi (strain MB_m1) TaxID=1072389 RepID=K1WMI1_MARBU|nr:amino-acid permease inda1 [Drepanopeziza brunnea f. sp. 'multigermtubi' MB_m1]EKD14061.1 amino-acid permease inda1 [Drepanopeziza brunnea f. sp. 'multigermtubi' MB_m1]KAJ5035470.1 hypothetical protein L3040_007937 [Drepanopeziza brunnea f. sp. 'multigermtubi']
MMGAFALDKAETAKSNTAPKTFTERPLLVRPKGARFSSSKAFDSFRAAPNSHTFTPAIGANRRSYNQQAAAFNTANSLLVRRLKGRHLQMIAMGGSIGTGLFIGTGAALATGGPASLLLAFLLIGAVLFCTIQALGELAVTFPVAGSFSAFATRFIDPAWGFATGWNYACQWIFTMPIEIMAAAITLEFWDLNLPEWAAITIFLLIVATVSLCGVNVYGEAEYSFSIIKVTAIIGFIILGVVINCGGTPDSGYIGGRYWRNPGAFHNGFKGFCNILVTASFSFSGTELIGLAAAETHNPSKALPTAIKKVFWRIALFYVISIVIIGLLVPYTEPQLLGRNDVDAKASPFIIAIQTAGIHGLDSVMNAVILISVLSVANSCMFGATRTLQALGEQGQAPRIFAYVDRKGRPLFSILVCLFIDLLAYLYASPLAGEAFTWLLALAGLSSIFTWASICFAHIRFRRAWIEQGNLLSDLVHQSPIGVTGSWIGLGALIGVLVAQCWVAISPTSAAPNRSFAEMTANFFEAYLATPIVVLMYSCYKIWYRTKWVRTRDVDLQTGRNAFESVHVRMQWKEDQRDWPMWKKLYKILC